MSNTIKKKKMKAWVVIDTYPRKIKHPIEPSISNAKIQQDEGHCCFGGSTYAMGIYRTEQEAQWSIENKEYGVLEQKIVPCIITY